MPCDLGFSASMYVVARIIHADLHSVGHSCGLLTLADALPGRQNAATPTGWPHAPIGDVLIVGLPLPSIT